MTPPRTFRPTKAGRLPSDDGLELAWYEWEPAGPPRGTLVVVHGHGEHAGRYFHVAQAFSEAGFSVLGFDARGHGQSSGPRGHAPSYGSLRADLSAILARARARPRIAYGHSLGGLLVLDHARHTSGEIEAVIATSPWLRLAYPAPPLKVAMGKALYALAPSLTLPTGLELAALSRDPHVVAAYAADPLVHDRLSVRLGIDLLNAGARVLAEAPGFHLPALLVHGTADRITDAGATKAFYQAAGSTDKTLRLWPDRFHETHNDPEWEAVLAFSTDWARARAGS